MMKQLTQTFLLTLLMSMVGAKAFAHFEMENADGKTIYYKIDSGTEAVVSTPKSSARYYSGKIVIPVSVTFNGVTYPVTRIDDFAFNDCYSLTSVTIPNSVTSIGDEAFSHCSSLNSIIIPNSVTSIGNYAFSSCSSLNSIIIPNSVTSIGMYAFSSCSRLTNITIPNSVTRIKGNAFNGTAWLENQPDGLVYAGKVAYKYKGTMPSNTNVVLQEGTLGISDGAFFNCSGLTSVAVPNSVKSIGKDAFTGTAWYDNQPNGLVYAGKFACGYKGEMPSNTSIVLQEGTLGIADNVFENCTSLTSITIPNSVTSIGDNAFYKCSGLTNVTIPNSVTSIGDLAFYNCI